MYRTTAFILILCLIQIGGSRRFYYPDTVDPNAIVFEGPTNAEFRKTQPKVPETPAGADYDYGEDKLDIKYGDPEDDQ